MRGKLDVAATDILTQPRIVSSIEKALKGVLKICASETDWNVFRMPSSVFCLFFFSSRRRHTRYIGDWSSDVCSSDLFTRLTCELIRNMRALPKPIIASLNGTVAGAGACIALASDIRIAAEEAKIAFILDRKSVV